MMQGTGYRGAERVRGFAQVSTGEAETQEGYRMILISTNRPMESGDLAMLELAVVADGFWSDRTRTCVAGTPSTAQTEAYSAILRAQDAACQALRPGVTAESVDAAARAVIADAGYADGFFHATGHGLGFRYHEQIPIIEPGVQTMLEPGMVITLEPGIYMPGLGGMRLEDDFLLTVSGSELLGASANTLSRTVMEATI
jgi:Xaa-Pro aminopeptidase